MAINDLGGIGTDGYLRVRKTSFGAIGSGTFTDIPASLDTVFLTHVENIENKRLVHRRYKEKNSIGKTMCSGTVSMEAHPSLLSFFFDKTFGLSVATTGSKLPTSEANNNIGSHIFVPSVSGETITPRFFDSFYVQGNFKPLIFDSCFVSSFEISAEVGQQVMTKFNVMARNSAEQSAESSPSFTYPAIEPFSFSDVKVMDVTDASNSNHFEIPSKSLNLNFATGVKEEDFYLGSKFLSIPKLGSGMPEISLSINTDSAQSFLREAKTHQVRKLEIQMSGELLVTGQVGNFETKIELPACQLNPETNSENSEESMMMDLEFDCGFAGTTSKDSVQRQMQISIKDTNPAL